MRARSSLLDRARARAVAVAVACAAVAGVAVAVVVVVPASTTGCQTHQCDTSSSSYYGGRFTDPNTYETTDPNADWIPYPGQVTLHVVFPLGGPSPGRAVVSIDGQVGIGTSPNGGPDFEAGENWTPAVGQLAEIFGVSSTGFFVFNDTCALYSARFVVHFAPPGFTIFGGVGPGDGGIATLDDTWTWNGTGWAMQGSEPTNPDAGPEIGPTAREGATMATVNGFTYLFGGVDGTNYLADTWSWNGSVWTQAFIAPQDAGVLLAFPSARADVASAVVNGATAQLVLFGGHGADVTKGFAIGDLGDTWTWDGVPTDSWVTVSLPAGSSPSARSGAAAAALGQQMILFGGSSNGALLGDTWVYDLNAATWSQQQPATSPSPRFHAACATIPGGVLLFGGESGDGPLGDTWLWDGTTWTQQPTKAVAPSARYQTSTGVLSDTVVLFGGTDGARQFFDTWTWSAGGWMLQSQPSPPTPRYGAAGAGP